MLALMIAAEFHQLTRILNRQHLEHQGIDEGEDGGVRADAQRQRERGDDREAGGLQKHPASVENVLP
jgi:hypothetical protein